MDGFSLDPRVDFPGMVVDPEPYDGTQTAELGFWVNESQILAAVRYANANAAHPYNLYTYNCTDFALGVLDAASIPKPSVGVLGVDFPMALQQSLPLIQDDAAKDSGPR